MLGQNRMEPEFAGIPNVMQELGLGFENHFPMALGYVVFELLQAVL